MYRKLPAVAIFFVLFVGSATAAWTITDIESPKSFDEVSNGTQTVQLIEVKDNEGDPVNKSRLDESSWVLRYNYSNTIASMEQLGSGYWYANFTANSSKTNIEYELKDTAPEGGEINASETRSFNDYNVEIINSFDKLRPGNNVEVEVNVTDEVAGQSEDDDADVYLTITNGTEYSRTELGYNPSRGLFTQIITIPDFFNSDVAIHAHAFNNSRGGSKSTLTTIYPESTGNITYLNASAGCNNNSFFSTCERTAEIQTGFNATILPASDVTLQLQVPKNNDDLVSFENISMEKNNGLWEANYTVPDINTSKYQKKLLTQYNASIDDENFIITRNITYDSYTIRDKSDPSAFPGSNFMVKLLFGKRFSLAPLNGTRIEEGNVTIDMPNGTEWKVLELDDFVYNEDNDLFEEEISISEDAAEGNYPIEVEAWNIYDEKKTRTSAVTVESADSSFNLSSDDLDYNYSTIGFHEETIEITNRLNEDIEVSAEFSSELENLSEFNSGDDLSLSDSETENVTISFDLPDTDTYEGELTLTGDENDYSKDIDIMIEVPDCETVNGSLCYDKEMKWINLTADQVQSYTRNITIKNIGGSSTFFQTTILGDVADYLVAQPSSNTVDSDEEQEFELNYTPKRENTFTGEVVFSNTAGDELRFDTKFVSNVENLISGMTTQSSINIAGAVRGGSVTRGISVTNTGDVNITGLSVSSSTLTPSMASLSSDIGVGDTEIVDLTLEDIQSSSGEVSGDVTITGETSQGSAESTLSVSGSLTEYESRIEDLRDRIGTLQDDASTSVQRSQLADADTNLTEVDTLYQQGNIEEADRRYAEIENKVNTLEAQINTDSSPDPDPDPSNPEPNTSTPEPQPNPGNNTGGGGGTFIIIAVIIFVLLIVGFVFYTSYIPEEGDPLYSVLGDR